MVCSFQIVNSQLFIKWLLKVGLILIVNLLKVISFSLVSCTRWSYSHKWHFQVSIIFIGDPSWFYSSGSSIQIYLKWFHFHGWSTKKYFKKYKNNFIIMDDLLKLWKKKENNLIIMDDLSKLWKKKSENSLIIIWGTHSFKEAYAAPPGSQNSCSTVFLEAPPHPLLSSMAWDGKW